MKLIAATIISTLLCFSLASSALAGEVEHGVISGSFDAFVEGSTPDGDSVQPYLDDMLDIMDDAAEDSYCEQYAASSAAIMATYRDALDADEYDSEVYAYMVTAMDVIWHELDRLSTQCLNEE